MTTTFPRHIGELTALVDGVRAAAPDGLTASPASAQARRYYD
jgi:hypothetical protein